MSPLSRNLALLCLPFACGGCAVWQAALGGDAAAPRMAYTEAEAADGALDQAPMAEPSSDEQLLAWGGPGDVPAAPGRGGRAPAAGDADGADPPPREKAPDTAVEPGRSTPLLIYTAELHLAVLDVAPQQRRVLALARELGGFVAYQDDSRVTIRVPSAKFEQAVEGVGALGDLLHRNVRALDVTEEFRDVSVRLRNAEAVRAQLETLLAKAQNVEEALEVQRELAKVTESIERFKGRLRFLEDRIAYSTIDVRFQPRPREHLTREDPFRLPFGWLQDVGLGRLLDLGY